MVPGSIGLAFSIGMMIVQPEVRDGACTTTSGLEIQPVYGPRLEAGTRPPSSGLPVGTRSRAARTRRCIGAGCGPCASTPASAPPRRPITGFTALLEAGQTGLSVAFDLPTQMGLDSDDPMAAGEVGKVGVAIDSLADMRTLFAGIPLGEVTTSMTINSTAAILLLLYQLVAEEQGVAADRIRGTVQNDILKEYIARGTYIYPAAPVDATRHGPLRVLRGGAAQLEHDLDQRLSHPRGRLDGGSGGGLHHRQRPGLRRGGAQRRARRR